MIYVAALFAVIGVALSVHIILRIKDLIPFEKNSGLVIEVITIMTLIILNNLILIGMAQ